MAVLTGKVIRFDEARGYGFVAPDTGSEDVFLHVNDLSFDKRLLTPGTRVQFVAEEGQRGLKASRVQIVDQPLPAPRVTSHSHDDGGSDDGMCDIMSHSELTSEVTEALLAAVPTLTAQQIVQVRRSMISLATDHGWVEG
ncbi:cold shock domain-containing protein [Actinophytocola xinjiangensis]|uniref:cold-shock protein n=1 Tax=Actinophytocola xinjiangensis TaxID=485602 RepID=UPI00318332B0